MSGCFSRTCSASSGARLMPPILIISFSRPRNRTRPSFLAAGPMVRIHLPPAENQQRTANCGRELKVSAPELLTEPHGNGRNDGSAAEVAEAEPAEFPPKPAKRIRSPPLVGNGPKILGEVAGHPAALCPRDYFLLDAELTKAIPNITFSRHRRSIASRR